MTMRNFHQIKISLWYHARKTYRQMLVPIIKRRIGPATTIICNNCLGSRISQDCGYRYNSPTVGLYFTYPSYVWFLKNLKDVKGAPLVFRRPSSENPVGGVIL